MKIKITHLITALFLLCSAYSWGQTWQLTPTMTAVLNNGVLTVSTTKEAEAMPDYAYYGPSAPWFSVSSGILSVVIRDSVTSIGNYAFGYNYYYNCPNLTSVKMGSSVITIGAYAFSRCTSLPLVTIPNSVITIGGSAFYECTSLSSVTIGSSVATIGESAFYGCPNLPSVTIPNSVTTIWPRAFANCTSLPSIVIPNSVTTLAGEAFSNCASLATVTLPASVEVMGPSIFAGCRKLTDVTVGWKTPLPIPANTFTNVNISAVNLLVPAGTEDLYKATPVWKEFKIAGTVGTEGVEASSLKAWATNGNLYITGLCAGESLRVFNVTGRLIYEGIASDTEQHIFLRDRGIYIIVAGQRSLKAVY